MPYLLVLRGSLVQALACGLIFAVLGFSRTAFLSAGLITFVAVWLGFLCARLIARGRHQRLSGPITLILTVIAGVVLGSASAFAFCCVIEVLPLELFLFVGAWVGVALALVNVRSWRHHALV